MINSDAMRHAITTLPTDKLQSILNGARDAFESNASYLREGASIRSAFYYGYVAAVLQAEIEGIGK
jgi:hypothetical protein